MVSSKIWGRGWCGVNAKNGVRLGGQGGCEPRIQLIVKMHKQSREGWGAGRGGVRVVVNHELKLL